jgi:CheY-like chemotaxis protein
MPTKRILLIDDEVDIHRIAQVGLMMEAGWELLTAQSSDEGLAIATSEPLDAILLDVMMPGRDGVATLKVLQESPETQAYSRDFFDGQGSIQRSPTILRPRCSGRDHQTALIRFFR